MEKNENAGQELNREDVLSRGQSLIDMYDFLAQQDAVQQEIMNYIKSLDERLLAMEQMLQQAGIMQSQAQQGSPLEQPVDIAEPQMQGSNDLQQLLQALQMQQGQGQGQ